MDGTSTRVSTVGFCCWDFSLKVMLLQCPSCCFSAIGPCQVMLLRQLPASLHLPTAGQEGEKSTSYVRQPRRRRKTTERAGFLIIQRASGFCRIAFASAERNERAHPSTLMRCEQQQQTLNISRHMM